MINVSNNDSVTSKAGHKGSCVNNMRTIVTWQWNS